MSKYSKQQLVGFLQREIDIKKDVYKRNVQQGYMQEATANAEISMLGLILRLLKAISPEEVEMLQGEPGDVHQECMRLYFSFYEKHVGVKPSITAKDGTALKELIRYLRSTPKINTSDEVIIAWRFILDHWELTGPFIGKQKSLHRMYHNIAEILDKIRNGHDKKSSKKSELQQLEHDLTTRRKDRKG